MRILGAFFATVLLLFILIIAIGTRYGTRKPTPGRAGPIIVCGGRFGNICSTR